MGCYILVTTLTVLYSKTLEISRVFSKSLEFILIEQFLGGVFMNSGYNVLEIKSRLIREFEKRGVKPYRILPDIGLSKNTLDSANKSMPKADTLAKIADYFGCSVDYLLGRTDEPNMTINVNQTGKNIVSSPINAVNNAEKPSNEMTAELVKMFETMSFSDKMKVMNFVLELNEKNKPL